MVGVFLVLALLPLDVTGPLGRAVGVMLLQFFGAGAVFVPLALFVVSLWGLGRFDTDFLNRLLFLFAGLVLVVPFSIGLAVGLASNTDLPPDHATWNSVQRAVGILAAWLVVSARAVVGTAGAIILCLLVLSSLTIYTFQWHPFKKLGKADEKEKSGEGELEQGIEFNEEKVAGILADEFGEEEEEKKETKKVVGEKEISPSPDTSAAPTEFPTDESLPAIFADEDELPPIDLLSPPLSEDLDAGEEELDRLADVLIDTLATFNVKGRVVGRTTGPVVTRYEVKPAPGVKVQKIAALVDDLALTMKARSIRIVAPIPGKAAVGVEVPNPVPRMVTFRELIDSDKWDDFKAGLPIALGRDLEGQPIIADLSKMPHLLIAGATGSGKSVCINTIITSLIYRYTPRELRMLMIDPKMVELATYNSLPHLRHPVVTKNKQAAKALKWVVHEMERRYELFSANTVRNLAEFNHKLESGKELIVPSGLAPGADSEETTEAIPYEEGPIPYIVVIVDELADLMMTVQAEVEKPLALLAQKARATGIHLILATQRPSVNVITGLIKANFPCRIAFRVASKVDSRTILDQNGAESLLGNGDMLFLPPGHSEPIRSQGAFISTEETEAVTDWYRHRKAARDEALRKKGLEVREDHEPDILDVISAVEGEENGEAPTASADRDSLFRQAAEICIQNQHGSTSLLQRRLRIGYGRAARIVDQLEDAGILGPSDGAKAREVRIGVGQIEEYM